MSRATKSFGGVRHCSLRALLSNSFLNDHKLNKMQSALVGNFVYVKAGLYFRLFLIRPYPQS
jgi:hypothetical protein